MNDYVNFSNARDQHEQRWLVRSSVQRHAFRRYHLICFAVLHIPLGARSTLGVGRGVGGWSSVLDGANGLSQLLQVEIALLQWTTANFAHYHAPRILS